MVHDFLLTHGVAILTLQSTENNSRQYGQSTQHNKTFVYPVNHLRRIRIKAVRNEEGSNE